MLALRLTDNVAKLMVAMAHLLAIQPEDTALAQVAPEHPTVDSLLNQSDRYRTSPATTLVEDLPDLEDPTLPANARLKMNAPLDRRDRKVNKDLKVYQAFQAKTASLAKTPKTLPMLHLKAASTALLVPKDHPVRQEDLALVECADRKEHQDSLAVMDSQALLASKDHLAQLEKMAKLALQERKELTEKNPLAVKDLVDLQASKDLKESKEKQVKMVQKANPDPKVLQAHLDSKAHLDKMVKKVAKDRLENQERMPSTAPCPKRNGGDGGAGGGAGGPGAGGPGAGGPGGQGGAGGYRRRRI